MALEYAGQSSIFEGVIPVETGTTRLVVVAAQPDEANFGKAETIID